MSVSGLTLPTRSEAEVRDEIARLDALAAQMFPADWEKANSKPTHRSKARRALRGRVVWTLKMNELRATGARCGNCMEFSPMPGPGNKGQMICDRGSDFHGYQIAKADGLCTDHKRAP